MNEEPTKGAATRIEEEEHAQSYLLWDCFVNWALTLEKMEKDLTKPVSSSAT